MQTNCNIQFMQHFIYIILKLKNKQFYKQFIHVIIDACIISQIQKHQVQFLYGVKV